MDETSLSLLSRLGRTSGPADWQRLDDLYRPLLRQWVRRFDVQESDADDLVQEVMLTVSAELPAFEHSGRAGAFRSWLRAILVNRLRRFWANRNRAPQSGRSDIELRLGQLDDPASDVSQLWNRQHDEHVVRRLLALSEPHFTAGTWTAFRRTTFDGIGARDAAEELGVSVNAVLIAKSRVLSRLRQEAEGLVQASSGFLAKA